MNSVPCPLALIALKVASGLFVSASDTRSRRAMSLKCKSGDEANPYSIAHAQNIAAKRRVGIQNKVAFWLVRSSYCDERLRRDLRVSYFFHRYPAGFSKNQKKVLRRKSQEHFRVKRGLLFYSGLPRSQADDAKRQGKRVDREWRQVPQTEEKRERIIQSCHSSLEGTNNS